MYQSNKLINFVYDNTNYKFNDVIYSVHGLIKKRHNSRLKPLLKLFQRSQYYSRDRMELIQFKKLESIVNYAYDNVPYYKIKYDREGFHPSQLRSIRDIEIIPKLSKKELQDNSGLITDSRNQIKSIESTTGGTTGTSLKFLVDQKTYDFRNAELLRYYFWHDYNPDKDKTVVIGGNALIPEGNPMVRTWRVDYPRNRTFFSSYYLTDENMQKYFEIMVDKEIEYLITYPSAAYIFSKFLNSNNLSLQLKKILTKADNLREYMIKDIKKAFGCDIFDHYGHGEPGCFAAGQCLHGNYHIPSENVILERDESGGVIETSLNNYSMPFIRYQMGDKIDEIRHGCPCGVTLPYFTSVFGREDEVVVTKSGRKFPRLSHIVKGSKNIIKSQFVQNSVNELILNLVPTKEYGKKDEEIILRNLRKTFVGEDIKFSLNIVNEILPTSSGKYKFVISKIKLENL